MKVRHRFAFNTSKTKIISFLDKHGIKYEEMQGVTVFYVYEDEDDFVMIKEFMTSNEAVSISNAIYTKNEIETADWLTVRSSWSSLYPQPEEDMNYRFATYDATNYCEGNPNISIPQGDKITTYRKYATPTYYCRKGLVQKESFVLKKEPNWGSRNFTMLHWVGDELFISPKTAEVLTKSDLSGFEYYDVKNKSKKTFNNVKQILIGNYVDKGLCADAIERTHKCPVCGFTKFHLKTGIYRFHKEVFEGIKNDIVKTTDKFGEIHCDSLILITHKFYRTIVDSKLDRGLIFEPIKLV